MGESSSGFIMRAVEMMVTANGNTPNTDFVVSGEADIWIFGILWVQIRGGPCGCAETFNGHVGVDNRYDDVITLGVEATIH
jgi:hypothetical protein